MAIYSTLIFKEKHQYSEKMRNILSVNLLVNGIQGSWIWRPWYFLALQCGEALHPSVFPPVKWVNQYPPLCIPWRNDGTITVISHHSIFTVCRMSASKLFVVYVQSLTWVAQQPCYMGVISHVHLSGEEAEAQRSKVIGPRSQPWRMVVPTSVFGHLMSPAFLITRITVIHRKLPMGRKDLVYNNSQVVVISDAMLVMSLQGTIVECGPFHPQLISFLLWVQPHPSSLGHWDHITLLRAPLGYHGPWKPLCLGFIMCLVLFSLEWLGGSWKYSEI